jgi:hypothetical protein
MGRFRYGIDLLDQWQSFQKLRADGFLMEFRVPDVCAIRVTIHFLGTPPAHRPAHEIAKFAIGCPGWLMPDQQSRPHSERSIA